MQCCSGCCTPPSAACDHVWDQNSTIVEVEGHHLLRRRCRWSEAGCIAKSCFHEWVTLVRPAPMCNLTYSCPCVRFREEIQRHFPAHRGSSGGQTIVALHHNSVRSLGRFCRTDTSSGTPIRRGHRAASRSTAAGFLQNASSRFLPSRRQERAIRSDRQRLVDVWQAEQTRR